MAVTGQFHNMVALSSEKEHPVRFELIFGMNFKPCIIFKINYFVSVCWFQKFRNVLMYPLFVMKMAT